MPITSAIARGRFGSQPSHRVFPRALSLGQYCFAKVWLTIATRGEPDWSAAEKSRPASRAIPITSKYRGVIRLEKARLGFSVLSEATQVLSVKFSGMV